MNITRSDNTAGRGEVILVKYENIIKAVDQRISHVLLRNDYRKLFEPFLDYSYISEDYFDLLLKDSTNIIEYYAKEYRDDGSWDTLKDDIINSSMDFFMQCNLLPFADDISDMLSQKYMIKEVIIQYPKFDARVKLDCEELFLGDSRVNVEFTSISEILQKRGDITTFVTDTVDDIYTAIEVGNIRFMEIILASFRHNYDINDDLLIDIPEMMRANICKIGTFIPYNIEYIREDYDDNEKGEYEE